MAYGKELRECAMRAYCKLKSLRKTSYIFGVSISTLSRWSARGIDTKYTLSGNGFKIRKTEVSDFIRCFVKTHPYCSHTEVARAIHEVFAFKPSRQLASVAIKELNFSKVKVRMRMKPPLQREPSIEKKQDIFSSLSVDNTICVDETTFQVNMSPRTGYTEKGYRLYRQHVLHRVNKRVCVCAISPVSGVFSKLYDRNVNGNIFAQFISDLPFPNGTNIILDNASIHKTQTVVAAAERKGFQLKFIPPYSPDYNPIENVFGIVKASFRKWNASTGRTVDEFAEGIAQSFSNNVNAVTVRKCYSHARKFISNSL